MNTNLKVQPNEIPFPFNEDDVAQMEQEGWAIFNLMQDEVQIQRDDFSGTFMIDKSAWEFVVLQAVLGKDLHQRAIAFIKKYNPQEFSEFVQDAVVVSGDSLKTKHKHPYYLRVNSDELIGFGSLADATNAQCHYRTCTSLDPETGL